MRALSFLLAISGLRLIFAIFEAAEKADGRLP